MINSHKKKFEVFEQIKTDYTYLEFKNTINLIKNESINEEDYKSDSEYLKNLWNGYRKILESKNDDSISAFKDVNNLDTAKKITLFLQNAIFYKQELNLFINKFLGNISLSV